MTDERTLYRVAGWLRLVPGDCVGIAVFTDGSNMQFLPETDDRLRISEFHPFFNDEGYTIERRIPPGADAAAYWVGSGVPIPFAKGGVTIIADSEGGSAAFLEGQDRGHPTVKSVAEIIEKAETGAFEREDLARKELEFESRHSTVFLEAPVHSRYWIEYLKRAALEAVTLPEDARSLIRARLQLIIGEWIKRFRTSGDPALLAMFAQEVGSLRIVNRAYVKTIYWDMATHLLASGNYKDLLAPALANQIQKAIPEGLYYYELNARSPKRTKRTDQVTVDVDLLSHMRRLVGDGDHNLDFRMALAAANLMFGREALHPDIHAQARAIASHLAELIERGVKSYTGRPPDHLVDRLLTMHRALVTLRQMMDWKDRSDSSVVALGLSETATFLMEQWLEDRA
jgi:DNA-dependent RNA polymerase auxiliary subunit epsilon